MAVLPRVRLPPPETLHRAQGDMLLSTFGAKPRRSRQLLVEQEAVIAPLSQGGWGDLPHVIIVACIGGRGPPCFFFRSAFLHG